MSAQLQERPQSAARTDDCWNRIGVHGDRSCAQLTQHVHCRNCPIYSSGAKALLDAALPAELLRASTEHFAQPLHSDVPDTLSADSFSVMVFRVRSEWLALPAVTCIEVASLRTIRRLPQHRNNAVLGVANIRGELLACVCLSTILNLAPLTEPPTAQRVAQTQRLLVVSSSSGAVVFPVDEVLGMQRFRSQAVKGAPTTLGKTHTYSKGILELQDRTVGLLDEQLLFHTVERSLA